MLKGAVSNFIVTVPAVVIGIAGWSFYAGQYAQARDGRLDSHQKQIVDLVAAVAENKADIKAEVAARLADHDSITRIEENTKGLMRAQGLKPASQP